MEHRHGPRESIALSDDPDRASAHLIRANRPASHSLPLAALLSLAGCDGAPSRNILGSYFPSWMVCALVGIAVASAARAVLRSTGILQEVPAPFVVILAIGCAATLALWLIWLA
jgi:hypothetical protein